MASNFTIANGKSLNVFYQEYCQNEMDCFRICERYKVELVSYDDLNFGQAVYGAAENGKLLHERIMIFRVTDVENNLRYYPVFSEYMGKALARHADIKLAPVLTVLYEDNIGKFIKRDFSYKNYALICLIAWYRSLTLMFRQTAAPIPFGIWSVYNVLVQCPTDDIDISVIRLLNNSIKRFLHENKNIGYQNLKEYIADIKKTHTLLNYKENDFDVLRQWLLDADPREKIYF